MRFQFQARHHCHHAHSHQLINIAAKQARKNCCLSWSPVFNMNIVRLATFLRSAGDVFKVCVLAAGILCPGEPFDMKQCPSRWTIQKDMQKMDCLQMICQREKLRRGIGKYRIARFLSPDSSPQKGFVYFYVRQELMRRPSGLSGMPPPGDPFGGFTWEKRVMPLCTYSGVAKKAHTGTKINPYTPRKFSREW